MALHLIEKQKQEGWQIVKFGEITKNISERVDPSETDLKVYVGLEHLDPQSLRITRRGVPSDVKGQKLRVRPGQIIFGKRRAYQKKVAVSDFDGICSAHAMVLEEIPGKIVPNLLPFFMQSDMFMDRAVAISEGSLSPTIKWKTLAVQEFSLPPPKRQKEILEIFENVEVTQLKNSIVKKASFNLRHALQNTFFKVPKKPNNNIKIEEISTFITSGSRGWAKYYDSDGDLFLRITNLRKDRVEIDLSDSKFVRLPIGNSEGSRTLLNPCDILVSVTAEIGLIGFVPENGFSKKAYVNQHLALIRADSSKIDPRYFAYMLASPDYYRYFLSLNGGGAKAGLSLETIKRIPLLIPTLNRQQQIARVFKSIESEISQFHLNQLNLISNRQLVFSNVWNQH